jgi:hypothetical protein
VINVEASHCYPDFPGFPGRGGRVLKPGGHFLYADFRFRDQFAEWDNTEVRHRPAAARAAPAPLQIVHL